MIFWIVLFGQILFECWYGSTIDLLIYVDVVYVDVAVLYQIVGYIIFESG